MKREKKWNCAIITTAIFILVLAIISILYSNIFLHKKFGILDEDTMIGIEITDIPENTLYITQDRLYYQRGELTLIIPSIDVFTAVGESTVPEILTQMPGLYEFAQLPFEEMANTSIAGHRDIYDMVFYSLDAVGQGDYLYLLYHGDVHRYLYRDTKIISADDWSVIYNQGFQCLTLTTCHPVGTTRQRLVVQAERVDVQPLDEFYRFTANAVSDIQ